jgi:hypothetical protein
MRIQLTKTRLLRRHFVWLAGLLMINQAAGAAPEPADSAKPAAAMAQVPAPVLLKGQVTYTVPKGTTFKLKLASVPSNGMKLGDYDLEGKLPPAQLNQPITARVTEDLYVDDNKVIPEGTIFAGRVTKIIAPRRLSRPGSLVLSFDTLTTPDGRKFAFRAEANNARESTKKTKAKGLGLIAAHAAGGAVVGAIVAYRIFGPEQTVAMHGYNIAGAAALGAVAATTYAIMKHGQRAVLEPGDDLNMEIDTDLLLPAATTPAVKPRALAIEGVNIEVVKSKVIKDGLDGHELKLELLITNDSEETLKSIDLYVEDDNGNRTPVTAGEDEEAELLFTVEPQSFKKIICHFAVQYPKLKRKLIWLRHGTHHVLISQRLP